jgi:hypothetical protein
MTWFSSWAVDGDHSSPDSYVEVEDTSSEIRLGIIKHNYPLGLVCIYYCPYRYSVPTFSLVYASFLVI